MTDLTSLSLQCRHSSALNVQVVAECNQPGACIAAVALAHGINANLVHKWRSQAQARNRSAAVPINDGFILVAIAAPAAPVVTADIRIELRRGPVAVTLCWPMSAATECARRVREVLR